MIIQFANRSSPLGLVTKTSIWNALFECKSRLNATLYNQHSSA